MPATPARCSKAHGLWEVGGELRRRVPQLEQTPWARLRRLRRLGASGSLGDYGSASVTHMLLIALFPDGSRWAVQEWVYDGRISGQLTEEQQARKVNRELVRGRSISEVVIDPAALAFRMALGKELQVPIQLADNEVLPGIQKVTEEIDTGLVRIDEDGCPELVRQGYNYTVGRAGGAAGRGQAGEG